MEEQFREWLRQRGYGEPGAVTSYSSAIPLISSHYSQETESEVDIYRITDQALISKIAHDYSQSGRFADFGYGQHGRFRAAIARYSEFFVHHASAEPATESAPIQTEQYHADPQISFSYERDLQTTLCAQISDLFPGYKIFGDDNLGVEFSIGGRRIDVLLECAETQDLVVIELKSGRADYRVFGQISMYISLVKRQFTDRVVKGVIVAGEVDESLRLACETNPDVSVKLYRMSLALEDA